MMQEWEQAAQDHRYDQARQSSGPQDQESIDRAEEAAIAEASELRNRITAASKEKDFRALLAIDSLPMARTLLGLLPEAIATDACTNLDDAVIWRTIQEDANTRRIKKAQGSFADFDLGLTRALIRKVDTEFLTTSDQQQYDELLLGITARTMEMDEVMEAVGPLDSPDVPPSKRRWWKR